MGNWVNSSQWNYYTHYGRRLSPQHTIPYNFLHLYQVPLTGRLKACLWNPATFLYLETGWYVPLQSVFFICSECSTAAFTLSIQSFRVGTRQGCSLSPRSWMSRSRDGLETFFGTIWSWRLNVSVSSQFWEFGKIERLGLVTLVSVLRVQRLALEGSTSRSWRYDVSVSGFVTLGLVNIGAMHQDFGYMEENNGSEDATCKKQVAIKWVAWPVSVLKMRQCFVQFVV